jgi:hypothetical protein
VRPAIQLQKATRTQISRKLPPSGNGLSIMQFIRGPHTTF